MKDLRSIFVMSHYSFTKRIFAFGLSFMIAGLSVTPCVAKSGKKLYETFFVGEKGTQYFIKPLEFSDEADNSIELDFTFRYKDEIKDSAIVNISFLSKEIIKKADSLNISNDSIDVTITNIRHMFSQRDKKTFNSRFASHVNLSDLENLFDNNTWRLILYRDNEAIDFVTTKGTKKKIGILDYEIFGLF